MRRHDLDLVSLIAGALFVFVAAAYLVAELSDHRLDGEWVFPGLLVGLGVLGLVASLWGGRPRDVPQADVSRDVAESLESHETDTDDTDDTVDTEDAETKDPLADTLVEPAPESAAGEEPRERP